MKNPAISGRVLLQSRWIVSLFEFTAREDQYLVAQEIYLDIFFHFQTQLLTHIDSAQPFGLQRSAEASLHPIPISNLSKFSLVILLQPALTARSIQRGR